MAIIFYFCTEKPILYNKMRPKAQHSNRNFMLGTFVLGTLVIGIVALFTALSVNLSVSKEEAKGIVRQADTYRFRLTESLYGNDIDIYLNDSLLYRGTPIADTLLTINRSADENAIIMVDRATDRMQITEVPAKQGAFRIEPTVEGIVLIAE